MKVVYYIVFFFWYLLSLLPLRFLYIFSDVLYYPLYYCIRYRRKVVRQNLTGSFPDKNEKELIRIEKQFYHFFCDYMIETIMEKPNVVWEISNLTIRYTDWKTSTPI